MDFIEAILSADIPLALCNPGDSRAQDGGGLLYELACLHNEYCMHGLAADLVASKPVRFWRNRLDASLQENVDRRVQLIRLGDGDTLPPSTIRASRNAIEGSGPAPLWLRANLSLPLAWNALVRSKVRHLEVVDALNPIVDIIRQMAEKSSSRPLLPAQIRGAAKIEPVLIPPISKSNIPELLLNWSAARAKLNGGRLPRGAEWAAELGGEFYSVTGMRAMDANRGHAARSFGVLGPFMAKLGFLEILSGRFMPRESELLLNRTAAKVMEWAKTR